MSEFINNREHRQKKLKQLIMKLHEGGSFDEVKKEFEKEFGNVSAKEISDLEQNIIMEGMPIEEVQRLCNVHSAVFKGSIDEIHRTNSSIYTPGHPLNTLKRENDQIKQFLGVKVRFHLDLLKGHDTKENREKIIKDLDKLKEIERHYLKKENLIFPYLEKYGMTGPPQVMWGVDDEIRELIKKTKKEIKEKKDKKEELLENIQYLITQIEEMIFKEENILFPMADDSLTQDEWLKVQDESDEFGYTFIEKPIKWIPPKFTDEEEDKAQDKDNLPSGKIKFETGVLNIKELELMLNHLPFDITFIDKNDVVKYFSHGKERIFPRTKAVIGRTVQNCHPPSSVHIVDKMLDDFKNKKKESEDFWINMKDLFVYIRYFAVRDENGGYIGSLEVTQNIKPLQEISGEKRLVKE